MEHFQDRPDLHQFTKESLYPSSPRIRTTRRKESRLYITRAHVTLQTSVDQRITHRAVLALCIEEAEPRILAVGADVAEVVATQKPNASGTENHLTITAPGELSAWNSVWSWPRPAPAALPDANSCLVIWPLRAGSWAPHITASLLRLMLIEARLHERPTKRKHTIVVDFAADFSPSERTDLYDAITTMLERDGLRFRAAQYVPPTFAATRDRHQTAHLGLGMALLTLGAIMQTAALRYSAYQLPVLAWVTVALCGLLIIANKLAAERTVFERQAKQRLAALAVAAEQH